MPTTAVPAPRPTFPWWAVLCLVGLDYFSSLAYLPSVALEEMRHLAPLAGAAVVLVTLAAAVPVYLYVVGRSPHGRGGLGLLEQSAPGWGGKLLLLLLLGFVATDFVLTRTLSVSDAAAHIAANPLYEGHSEQIIRNREVIRGWMPELLAGRFFDFWNEQLVLSVGLSLAGFAFYRALMRGMSRGFMGLAVFVVVLYLLVNLVVIGSGLLYLQGHPGLVAAWQRRLVEEVGDYRVDSGGAAWAALWVCLAGFPALAMGLSGFELSLTAAPLVRGAPGDDPARPRGRVARCRLLIVAAALVMSVLVLSSTFVVAILVPEGSLERRGRVSHRALASLAHGEAIAGGRGGAVESDVSPLFGPAFGTVYDLSTVLILCLAGASAAVSLRELVPDFLSRFGMQLAWAHRLDVITHLFNGVILVVTVAFRASVSAQLGAYAAAVLALLFGASLAATLDAGRRWRGAVRRAAQAPFALATGLFAVMAVLIVVQRGSGVLIALAFVGVVLVTAITSRWLRSTELRFEGFEFADGASAARWAEVCRLDFQVLVPHNPSSEVLGDKERMIREQHRLGADVPVIFIEVHLGDTSDFFQKPIMRIEREGSREVIRVSRCTSVGQAIAAIALAFREVGRPPEVHFSWSEASPMAATVGFLLFGQGNVPWIVHALLRHAEPDPARRPRVVIA